MREILIALSALLVLGTIAWLLDVAHKAVRKLTRLRQLERDAAYNEGWLSGFDVGCCLANQTEKIANRAARLGR